MGIPLTVSALTYNLSVIQTKDNDKDAQSDNGNAADGVAVMNATRIQFNA